MKLSVLNSIIAVVCTGVLCSAQPKRTAGEWVGYYAAEFNVPPELVQTIIQVESNWRSDAVSDRGAVGLMQLVPTTAATFDVTNRFDVQQNVHAGVAYLARLLALFRGDVRLVAAAYFVGERRIASAGLGYSNAEVFGYVQKLVGLYREKCLLRKEIEGGNWP